MARYMRSLIVCMLIMLPFSAQADYLTEEKLHLVPDGRTITTTKPLHPSHEYHLTFHGADGHSVRSLLQCDQVEKVFILRYTMTECNVILLLNHQRIPRRSDRTDTLAAYFHDIIPDDYYIETFKIYVHGNGKRLSLSTTRDITTDLPRVLIRVISLTYQEEQERVRLERILAAHAVLEEKQRKEHQAKLQQERAVEEERLRKERLQREHEQRERVKRIAAERARQAEVARQEALAREQEIARRRVVFKQLCIGAAIVGLIVVCIAVLTAPARHRARVERLAAEKRAQAARRAEEERLRQEAAVEEARQRDEDERLRQEAAAEATRRHEETVRAAEEQAWEEELQAIQKEFDTLCLLLDPQDQLSDPEYIERYVQKNYAALIRDRENIEADYMQLLSNKKLVAKLKAEAPHILERTRSQEGFVV